MVQEGDSGRKKRGIRSRRDGNKKVAETGNKVAQRDKEVGGGIRARGNTERVEG